MQRIVQLFPDPDGVTRLLNFENSVLCCICLVSVSILVPHSGDAKGSLMARR